MTDLELQDTLTIFVPFTAYTMQSCAVLAVGPASFIVCTASSGFTSTLALSFLHPLHSSNHHVLAIAVSPACFSQML